MNITIKAVNESEAERYLELLSNEELDRAKSYKGKSDYLASVVAHGTKRELLSKLLNCKPNDITFGKGKYGKPFVKNSKNIYFNLSHSEGYVAIATSRNKDIGIDIDFEKKDNFSSNFEMILTRNEIDEYKKIQYKKYYLLKKWVIKESITKANGTGLYSDFRKITLREYTYEKSLSNAIIDGKYFFSKLFTFKKGFFSVASSRNIKSISINYL